MKTTTLNELQKEELKTLIEDIKSESAEATIKECRFNEFETGTEEVEATIVLDTEEVALYTNSIRRDITVRDMYVDRMDYVSVTLELNDLVYDLVFKTKESLEEKK